MDQLIKTETEIKARYQITIPVDIRKKAKLNVGDTLIWQYDEPRAEIMVMPKPKSFSDKLWGLRKELWEHDSADEYVRKERESW